MDILFFPILQVRKLRLREANLQISQLVCGRARLYDYSHLLFPMPP